MHTRGFRYRPTGISKASRKQAIKQLECGPVPNVMAALRTQVAPSVECCWGNREKCRSGAIWSRKSSHYTSSTLQTACSSSGRANFVAARGVVQ